MEKLIRRWYIPLSVASVASTASGYKFAKCQASTARRLLPPLDQTSHLASVEGETIYPTLRPLRIACLSSSKNVEIVTINCCCGGDVVSQS